MTLVEASPAELRKRILLIQVDGKMPNLALMKISSYYRSKGVEVGFRISNPDTVYVSCIFIKNLPQALGLKGMYPDAEFYLGGPALYAPNSLSNEMDYVKPDYDLYGIDYSLGFTTRGCPNQCPFCIVPKLEGDFREYQPISLFHDPRHSKLILWDNNFLASKKLWEKLDYIEDRGLKVSLNQGLDARLITEKIAGRLADLPLMNLKFTSRCYYFSWDLVPSEAAVFRGLQRMIDAGVHPRYLMVYVLVGFNTTHDQDMYRFKKLRELGVDPFIMIYNNRRDDPWIRRLSRWVNKRIYKTCSWEDYKH